MFISHFLNHATFGAKENHNATVSEKLSFDWFIYLLNLPDGSAFTSLYEICPAWEMLWDYRSKSVGFWIEQTKHSVSLCQVVLVLLSIGCYYIRVHNNLLGKFQVVQQYTIPKLGSGDISSRVLFCCCFASLPGLFAQTGFCYILMIPITCLRLRFIHVEIL